MYIEETGIKDLIVITPELFEDHRGWFMMSYSAEELKKFGIDTVFVQDNHSMSKQKNTLRGLHFQTQPKAQAKLVRCVRGRILDAAVDLRTGSPTYRRWFAAELSEENKKQLFIPKGFAHGFLTLTEQAEVEYKVDEYYSPLHDRSIRFDDPEIGVDWGISSPVLSDKDRNAPFLKDSDVNF